MTQQHNSVTAEDRLTEIREVCEFAIREESGRAKALARHIIAMMDGVMDD